MTDSDETQPAVEEGHPDDNDAIPNDNNAEELEDEDSTETEEVEEPTEEDLNEAGPISDDPITDMIPEAAEE